MEQVVPRTRKKAKELAKQNNKTVEKESTKLLLNTIKERKNVSKDLNKARKAYIVSKSKEISKKAVNSLHDNITNAAKTIGIKLEEHATKYEENIRKLEEIEKTYNENVEYARNNYIEITKDIEDTISKLKDEKNEILAEAKLLTNDRDQYIMDNEDEFHNKMTENFEKMEEIRKQAIEALENNDIETASKLTEECKQLEANAKSIHGNFEPKISEYDEKIDEQREKYEEINDEIEQQKDLLREFEDDLVFNLNCEDEERETAIANLNNNNLFTKIKGILSRKLLNSAKKLNEKVVKPFENKVNKFSNETPNRVNSLKEKYKDRKVSIKERIYDSIIEKLEQSVEKKQQKANILNEKLMNQQDNIQKDINNNEDITI